MNFRIEARPYSDADVVELVAQLQAHFVEVYGGPDEAVVDVDEFLPPQGLMLVGLLDGVPVAMGGWRRLPDGGVPIADADGGVATADADGGVPTAEIKRMYVVPSAQRRGLARLVLAEVERTAAQAGVERVVLNTGPHQGAAIALYERSGYEPAPAFGYYAEHGDALFYAKTLTTGVPR